MRNLLIALAVIGLFSTNVYAGSTNQNGGETPAQEAPTNQNGGETPEEPKAPVEGDPCDHNGDGDSICSALHDAAKAAWGALKQLPVMCEMDYRMAQGALIVGFGVGEGEITCQTEGQEPKTSTFDQGELIEISVGPQVGFYKSEGKIYFVGLGFGRDVDVLAMVGANAGFVVGTSGFSVGAGVAGLAGVDADGVSANAAVYAKIAEKVEGLYIGANLALTVGAIWTPWTHDAE